MTNALMNELMADPICTIGQIPSFADVPHADMAIFLDGDVTNMDKSNVIDFYQFQNEYTYEDYLMNFEMTDRLFETCLSLQQKLVQAQEVIAKLQNSSPHR